MKIVRVKYKKKSNWGIIKGQDIHLLKQAPFSQIKYTGQKVNISRVRLLAPVVPGKIVMVGLNYKKHAKELKMKIPKEPIIFLKPPSSVIGPGQAIIYPPSVNRLDYEAELAFVIKKKARNIPEKKAKEYILGYACCNDITARDLQKKDGQWTRAKSFDTFCPLGPHIETQLDIKNLTIRSYLNGKLKQDSSTADFIFPVFKLLTFISNIMTLHPGDVISTGTPQGVGAMNRADTIEIQIEGLGSLKNTVR